MLALAASLLVALLLVIPELLQRAAISFFIPLKTIDRSRSEQLARSLFSVLLPLGATLALVHSFRPLHDRVFSQYISGAGLSVRTDAKTLFSSLASDEVFRKVGDAFYLALGREWASMWRFLLIFYALCIAIGVSIGVATLNYGQIRSWSERHSYTQWLRWLINKLLLERVSFWHALLTSFALGDKSGEIVLDVLASNDILYQGVSFQYFLDSDAKLAGIILKNPRRFSRKEYEQAKAEGPNRMLNKSDYWRPIPSESLFIFANTIVNININYQLKRSLADVLQKFVSQALRSQNIRISIEPSTTVSSEPSTPAPSGTATGSAPEIPKIN